MAKLWKATVIRNVGNIKGQNYRIGDVVQVFCHPQLSAEYVILKPNLEWGGFISACDLRLHNEEGEEVGFDPVKEGERNVHAQYDERQVG